MSKPTAMEIRDFLEGYGIDKDILTDKWIENRRDRFVIPHVKSITRMNFDGITTVTENYSGNGNSILILNRRPIVALTDVFLVTYNDVDTRLGIANIQVIKNEGILKSVGVFENYPYISIFPKGVDNLKITYTYGFSDYPDDVKEAVIYLCAEQLLGVIGSRTGGGSLGVQAHNRGYGPRGKYQDLRNDLARQARSLLSAYMTSITGA